MRLGKAQIEQIVSDAAQDFDAFYNQPCSATLKQHTQTQPIQVLTFDGKGVVMRPEALREATRKKVEARAQQAPHGFTRKEKSNRKRMAIVAGIYHIDRHRLVQCPGGGRRRLAPHGGPTVCPSTTGSTRAPNSSQTGGQKALGQSAKAHEGGD